MKRSLLATALLLTTASVSAATFTVTRLDDPAPNGCAVDDCSLREAIQQANQTLDADVVLVPAGTLTLAPQASGAVTIDVYGPVRIDGAGKTTTVVRSSGAGSMFAVHADATFRRMTLRDGLALGSSTLSGVGGAIRVHGAKLTLSYTVLRNHTATNSGAVAVMGGGSADISYSDFIANASFEDAGALSVTGGSASIAASQFYDNEGFSGGAIAADHASLEIVRGSSIHHNRALSGGGISSDSKIAIDDTSEVSFNTASGYGGGFYGPGTLTVIGVPTVGGTGLVRVEGNSAARGGAFAASQGIELERVVADGNQAQVGGALYQGWSHPLAVTHSRFAANHATQYGGGLVTWGSGQLRRVSLDGNSAGEYGGAMVTANGAAIEAIDLDVHGNSAPSAAALRNSGTLTLRHATIWNNLAGHAVDAITQSGVGSSTYANSIPAGRCTGTTAASAALGKTFRTTSLLGGNCTGTTTTTAELALKRGLYGNEFEVTGLASSASVAINVGSAGYCVAEDVRDATRDSKCDVGAFEYGAVAP